MIPSEKQRGTFIWWGVCVCVWGGLICSFCLESGICCWFWQQIKSLNNTEWGGGDDYIHQEIDMWLHLEGIWYVCLFVATFVAVITVIYWPLKYSELGTFWFCFRIFPSPNPFFYPLKMGNLACLLLPNNFPAIYFTKVLLWWRSKQWLTGNSQY